MSLLVFKFFAYSLIQQTYEDTSFETQQFINNPINSKTHQPINSKTQKLIN